MNYIEFIEMSKRAAFDFDSVRREQEKARRQTEAAIEANRSKTSLNHAWKGLGSRSNEDLLWDLGGAAAGGTITYALAKMLGAKGSTARAAAVGGAFAGGLGTDIYRSDAGMMNIGHYADAGVRKAKRLLLEGEGARAEINEDYSNLF